MKVVNVIVKVVIALAAVAGAVYLAATYGDKIVAWAKKMLGSCPCCKKDAEPEAVEPSAEEAPAEEAPAEEAPAEEAPEAPAEGEVTASEADFEG